MEASKVTLDVLLTAADRVGVSLDARQLNSAGTRFRVKVNPRVPLSALLPSGRRRADEKGDAPYQRVSASPLNYGRRVHAVCWHGFRDFFRAVFAQAPGARFRTALDTWDGSADFEARFAASGLKNVGSQFQPVPACLACRCGEEGDAR